MNKGPKDLFSILSFNLKSNEYLPGTHQFVTNYGPYKGYKIILVHMMLTEILKETVKFLYSIIQSVILSLNINNSFVKFSFSNSNRHFNLSTPVK